MADAVFPQHPQPGNTGYYQWIADAADAADAGRDHAALAHVQNVDDLADVSTVSAVDSATIAVGGNVTVLVEIAGQWRRALLHAAPAVTLDDLTDVNLSGATTDSVLKRGSDGIWRPSAATPTPPLNLKVTSVGNQQVALSWDAANGNGSAVTGYQVTISPIPASGGATRSTVGAATSTVVSGLANATTYTFTVAAVNAVGAGGQSTSVTATPVAPTGGGTVSWSGDFETGDLSAYTVLQQTSGRISVYTATSQPTWPAPRQGTYACRFNTDNADFPGDANPRSQLNGNISFNSGADFYFGFSCYIPTALPSNVGLGSAFFSVAEIMGDGAHGSPEAGGYVIRQDSGNPQQRLCLAHGSDNGYGESWAVNIIKGAWFDIVHHVKLSTDPSVGFVEVWLNGVQQTLSNGGTKRFLKTLATGDSGIYPVVHNYRGRGSIAGQFAIYHDNVRVGTTYAAAAGS